MTAKRNAAPKETEYRPLTFADLKSLCCEKTIYISDKDLNRFMRYDSPVDADQWSRILTAYPEFVGECELRLLGERHWKNILAERPELAEHCPHREWTAGVVPWEKSFDPASVPREKLLNDLIFHPVHAKYCKLSQLSAYEWVELLVFHPEFIVRCNIPRIAGRASCYADTLLELQPQWTRHFNIAKLMDVGAFLKKHPEHMDGCEWEKIDWDGWRMALWSYPELLEHCDLSKFPDLPKSKCEGENASAILLLNKVWKYTTLEYPERKNERVHELICRAIRKNPGYLEKWDQCTKFMWQDECPELRRLGSFLAEYPELLPLCRREWLTARDIGDLLIRRPELIGEVDFERLSVKSWCEILMLHPELAGFCGCWNKFSYRDWLYLLGGSRLPYGEDWTKTEAGKRVLPFRFERQNPYTGVLERIGPHPEFFPRCPARIYKKWTRAFEWKYLLDAGCPVRDAIPAELKKELGL